jgi:hypothetical protein
MRIARLPAVSVVLGIGLAGMLALPALALEKIGMPCLSQEEETCLPTSTANLMVWFGQHGYPNLIKKGDDASDGYIHTVHAMITAVHATYQMGTDTVAITYGIQKYIREAGYSADVEYRGIDWSQLATHDIIKDPDLDEYRKAYRTPAAFSADWLQQNDDPNKGFILLVIYVKYDPDTGDFSNPFAGHAVTLVNAEPDTIVIHDPANDASYPGRKIITPRVLTGGTFNAPGFQVSTAGLMILDAPIDEMWRPADGVILLTGAVCVTMHPDSNDTSIVKGTAGAPNGVIGSGDVSKTAPGAGGTGPGAAPAPAASPGTGWARWLFNLIFSK